MAKVFTLLWFDVDKERDTTSCRRISSRLQLWFDVDKERDTTCFDWLTESVELWFDVDKERDTTRHHILQRA